jgi:hypothetical protein
VIFQYPKFGLGAGQRRLRFGRDRFESAISTTPQRETQPNGNWPTAKPISEKWDDVARSRRQAPPSEGNSASACAIVAPCVWCYGRLMGILDGCGLCFEWPSN